MWHTEDPGTATIQISLKSSADDLWNKQYPLAQRGIQPLITKFLKYGLVQPGQSLCNTLILPIKEQSGENTFVQDPRPINKAIVPVHPIVPSPYTILTRVMENTNRLNNA